MNDDPHLQLLRELGIHLSREEWEAAHPELSPTWEKGEPTLLPVKPHHYDPPTAENPDPLPVFTSSQVAWCDPECYGWTQYEVVEDEATAHPFCLSYDDERYYRANHRPVHRYSRPYRLRWTLAHVVGHVGKLPDELHRRLKEEVARHPHVIEGRGAYEWVRHRLKAEGASQLYLSIPMIVRVLGGPRWKVSERQYGSVLADALALHKTFDALARSGRLVRRRFPKMQFVLLRLLDRHGVAPPYRVLWARTSIKRRQLRRFLRRLDRIVDLRERGDYADVEEEEEEKDA